MAQIPEKFNTIERYKQFSEDTVDREFALRVLKKGARKRLKRAVKGIALVVPVSLDDMEPELSSCLELCGVPALETRQLASLSPRKIMEIFT